MHSPMPVPSTNMYSDSSQTFVPGSIRDSGNSPTPMTNAPTIGKVR